MTAFTFIINLLIVQGMVETNGLSFLGIKELWKNHPSDNETGNQPDYKEQDNGPRGPIFICLACCVISRGGRYRILIPGVC
jgi:hypothetical protein